MRKVKIAVLAVALIAGVTIVNAQKKGPHDGKRGEAIKTEIIKELQLDEAMQEQFTKLFDLHKEEKMAARKQMKELKTKMGEGDISEKDYLAVQERMKNLKMEKAEMEFTHKKEMLELLGFENTQKLMKLKKEKRDEKRCYKDAKPGHRKQVK